MSRTIGNATQQLAKEVQVEASGTVVASTQQTPALVETVQGELQAQINANLQEMKKQNKMMRGDMQQITDEVQLLTKQLNDGKVVNKEMLNAVEVGVKGELREQIAAATGKLVLYLADCRYKPPQQTQLQKH